MIKENMSAYPIASLEEYGYKDHTKAKKVLKVFSIIVVCFVVLMLYLSVLVIAIQSFNSSDSTSEFANFTFEWYGKIFEKRALATAIGNTFLTSVCATLLATVFGTLIAIGIHYLPTKKRQRIMLLNNIPLLNADIVTGTSLMLVFSLLLPIFPYIFGFPTLLMAHLFFTLPYVILSVLPKLKEIDPNLLDAANDLGVKPMKAIWKVIIPSIRAGILTGMIFAFTMSFDDFVISYFTTGNGFDNLSIWVYSSIGRKSLTPSVYAFNTLVVFVSMAILLIVNFLGGKKHVKKA